MRPQSLCVIAAKRCRPLRAAAQRGVTLVELMIAMALGLLITAGVLQVFASSRASFAFNDGMSFIQENGRWAIDHIASHVRMAGYTGCLSTVPVFNHLGGAANPLRDDLVNGLQGFEADNTNPGETFAAAATNPAPSGVASAWTPALPADLVGRVVPGSDVLAVRYVSGASQPLVAPFSSTTHLFAAVDAGFAQGQVLVVTDCQKASIFQLSNDPATTLMPAPGAMRHHVVAGAIPGNANPADWTVTESYGLGSEVAALETVIFYVGEGANASEGGNGVPSLFALRLTRLGATNAQLQAFELIEGVDSMQVRYGVDADNDRQVESWQSADTVDAGGLWPQVLSVEIALLMRSSDEDYNGTIDTVTYNLAGTVFDPVNDRRFRQVFGTTVGLRNRLP